LGGHFSCTPGRELVLAAVSRLTTRIPAVRLDILDRPAGIARLSTVKLDLVRPGFRSLSKSTDATLMNLKGDQFRPNSVGPRFCSALFFAST